MSQFDYMLLSRLQSDCYSGVRLWGITPEHHAEKMVELWKRLDIKPQWLPAGELKELYYRLTRRNLDL